MMIQAKGCTCTSKTVREVAESRRAMYESHQAKMKFDRYDDNDEEDDNDDSEEDEENDKKFKYYSFMNSWIRQNFVLLVICLMILMIFIVFVHPTRPQPPSQLLIPTTQVQLSTRIPSLITEPVLPAFKANPETHKLQQQVALPWEGCETTLPNPDPRRHIVPPPKGPITLVCCNTTKGPLSIEVHLAWAPNGANRFLYMVKDHFFTTNVPLFRALKDFLVQFGLAGDPKVHKRYMEMGHLIDDPQWLPAGPPGREINGTKRFQKGYMAYAGAGKNSRDTQLIMALADNKYLGGGSPWEVPWGQVIGERSFQTMANIYTGYGEKPSQGKIMNRGAKYIQDEFPLIDFMNACIIVKEGLYG